MYLFFYASHYLAFELINSIRKLKYEKFQINLKCIFELGSLDTVECWERFSSEGIIVAIGERWKLLEHILE